LLETPGFRMPFGGLRPSNTIHIDVLANAVVALATTAETPSGTYSIADVPRTSLGEVFAWHARLAGLPLPPPMPDDLSEEIARKHASAATRMRTLPAISGAVVQTIGGAARSLLKSDQTRHLASAIARELPSTVLDRMKVIATDQNFKGFAADGEQIWSPGLFSDPMPGPYVDEVVRGLSPSSLIAGSEAEFVEWLSAWREPAWPSDPRAPFWVSAEPAHTRR